MYVKLPGYPDLIYQAHGESVELGSIPWHDTDPSEASLADIIERLGTSADAFDRTRIEATPYGYQDGDKSRPFWQLKWAKFQQWNGEHKIAISTSPIFLLGDNGKTIDRTA